MGREEGEEGFTEHLLHTRGSAMIPVDPPGPPAQATEEGAGLRQLRALGRWKRVEWVLTSQGHARCSWPSLSPFPRAPFSFLLCEMGSGDNEP